MQAKEGVLDRLNGILTHELTAVNQYFVHAKMCEHWGYERLHHKLREYSIEEMRDAEELIEHILYLEGIPNLQRLGTVQVGETVLEDLQLDLEQERSGAGLLADGIAHCLRVGDYTTHALLEGMIKGTEEQVGWFETQLTAIDQVGLAPYLSQQLTD